MARQIQSDPKYRKQESLSESHKGILFLHWLHATQKFASLYMKILLQLSQLTGFFGKVYTEKFTREINVFHSC